MFAGIWGILSRALKGKYLKTGYFLRPVKRPLPAFRRKQGTCLRTLKLRWVQAGSLDAIRAADRWVRGQRKLRSLFKERHCPAWAGWKRKKLCSVEQSFAVFRVGVAWVWGQGEFWGRWVRRSSRARTQGSITIHFGAFTARENSCSDTNLIAVMRAMVSIKRTETSFEIPWRFGRWTAEPGL